MPLRTSASGTGLKLQLGTFIAVGILFASEALGVVTCPAEPQDLALLIPWYVFPSVEVYAELAKFGYTCRVYAVITGPASGPPTKNLQLYNTTFWRLKDAGVQLFGYVHAMKSPGSTAPRSKEDLRTDIRTWFTNFPGLLRGIFVDEVVEATTGMDSVGYFSTITGYIQEQGGLVVFNPGTKISCRLAYYADIYVRFESYASEFNKNAKCECGNVSSCSALLHGRAAPGKAALSSLVQSVSSAGFSYVYITDDVMPNPWDRLPSYWDQLVATLPGVKLNKPPNAKPPSRAPPPKASKPPPRLTTAKPPPKPARSPPRSQPPQATPAPDSSGVWRPAPGTRWQYQLENDNFMSVLRSGAAVFDVDIDMVASLIAQASAMDKDRSQYKVVCYFSAGSYEPARVEADEVRGIRWPDLRRRFPQRTSQSAISSLFLGPLDPPFGEEQWLNIRNTSVRDALVNEVMKPRIDDAAHGGCDGVEFDNVDAYDQGGLPSKPTMAQQLAYNQMLLDYAHAQGLAVGLKNSLALLTRKFADGRNVKDAYDFFVNEECFMYNECDAYNVAPTRAVFGIEYCDARKEFGGDAHNLRPECFCALANKYNNFATNAGRVLLRSAALECRAYCSSGLCTAPKGGNPNLCRKDTPKDICPLYGL